MSLRWSPVKIKRIAFPSASAAKWILREMIAAWTILVIVNLSCLFAVTASAEAYDGWINQQIFSDRGLGRKARTVCHRYRGCSIGQIVWKPNSICRSVSAGATILKPLRLIIFIEPPHFRFLRAELRVASVYAALINYSAPRCGQRYFDVINPPKCLIPGGYFY